VAQGLVLTLGCWGVLLLRQWWLRALLVFAALLGLGAGELALRAAEKPEHGLRLTFVDVGQGDSTLVDLPDGRAMLVDAAGASFAGPDPGERALLPLLRARRRDHLAVVALTHPHPDHFAGLESLLGHIQIGEVWVSGQALAEQPHGSAARLLGQVRAHGIPIRTARKLCGRARLLGGARVDVLSPCPGFDAGYAANDNSLVLRLTYGRERALLAGDIERASERRLLREGADLRADVLKVPHHGSRTSSTTPFLRAVSPRYAVVSCGRANRFGHPHPSALTRLRATAGTLVRTDRSGGVVLRTRGHGWQLETWRGDRPP
jgi:competence protein ComEC